MVSFEDLIAGAEDESKMKTRGALFRSYLEVQGFPTKVQPIIDQMNQLSDLELGLFMRQLDDVTFAAILKQLQQSRSERNKNDKSN